MGCGHRVKMSTKLVDTFEMDAAEKWKKFRIPPYRVIVHVLLLAALTAQVHMRNKEHSRNRRNSQHAFTHLLLPANYSATGADPLTWVNTATFHLYEVDQCLYAWKSSVRNYFAVENTTLDFVQATERIAMDIEGDGYTASHQLNNVSDLESILQPNPHSFFKTVNHVVLKFTLVAYNTGSSLVSRDCVQWTALHHYYFQRGEITVTPYYDATICTTGWASLSATMIVMMVVAILCVVHIVFMMLTWWRSAQVLQLLHRLRSSGPTSPRARSLSKHHSRKSIRRLDSKLGVVSPLPSEREAKVKSADTMDVNASFARAQLLASHLRLRDLGPLLQLPNVLAMLAHVTILVQNINVIVNGEININSQWKVSFGLAAACSWISSLQYLRFSANYYLLVRTLEFGVPRVAQFLVGVLPVFVGYALFGMVVFGPRTYRFSDLEQTSITLFAILNGDVVRETYLMVIGRQDGGFIDAVSQIYLYLFLFTFIYVVLMATVAVMEEAFFNSRPPEKGEQDFGGAATEEEQQQRARAKKRGWKYTLPTRLHLVLLELETHQSNMTMAELFEFAAGAFKDEKIKTQSSHDATFAKAEDESPSSSVQMASRQRAVSIG